MEITDGKPCLFLPPTDSIYTERYMGTPDANEAGYYVRL